MELPQYTMPALASGLRLHLVENNWSDVRVSNGTAMRVIRVAEFQNREAVHNRVVVELASLPGIQQASGVFHKGRKVLI